MRYVQMFCLFLLISALTATAQVFPSSNGSCRVAASGLEGCNWMSGAPGKAGPSKTAAAPEIPALFVTRFILAPDASLDSRSIVGSQVLIVGKNNGEISNEKKSSSNRINVFDGLVMLMPAGEPYLLKNIGKDNVDLLLIEIRK
jgi:hypothetical protein